MKLLSVFILVGVALGAAMITADNCTDSASSSGTCTTTPAPTGSAGTDGEVLPVIFTATFNSTQFANYWSDNTTVDNIGSSSSSSTVVQFTFNQKIYLVEGRAASVADTNAPTSTASDVSSTSQGSAVEVDYTTISYALRYQRETYLLKADRSGGLESSFGIEKLTYVLPAKPLATVVPVPLPASNVEIPAAGSLRFFIKFRVAYHYTDPADNTLQLFSNPYTVGPNITGISDIIAEIVGITDPADYDRVRFLATDINLPANRYLRMLWNLQPLSYLASFEIDTNNEVQTPTTSLIYQRILYMQTNDRSDLCNSLEGCMEIVWQPTADILTFAQVTTIGSDEYWNEKIWFLVVLLIILCFFGVWLGVLWVKSKGTTAA